MTAVESDGAVSLFSATVDVVDGEVKCKVSNAMMAIPNTMLRIV